MGALHLSAKMRHGDIQPATASGAGRHKAGRDVAHRAGQHVAGRGQGVGSSGTVHRANSAAEEEKVSVAAGVNLKIG
jgi:hypothetical protein